DRVVAAVDDRVLTVVGPSHEDDHRRLDAGDDPAEMAHPVEVVAAQKTGADLVFGACLDPRIPLLSNEERPPGPRGKRIAREMAPEPVADARGRLASAEAARRLRAACVAGERLSRERGELCLARAGELACALIEEAEAGARVAEVEGAVVAEEGIRGEPRDALHHVGAPAGRRDRRPRCVAERDERLAGDIPAARRPQ